MAVTLYQPATSDAPNTRHRRWWSVVTRLLAAAAVIEAAFAGAMLSGVDWARTAHAANAAILIASTIVASVVAIATLHRVPHGMKLSLTLMSLATLLVVQAVVGALSAKGANLLWVHVPLGVAVFGLAVRAATGARKLHGE